MTIIEAEKRIKELEEEVQSLKEELAKYEGKKFAGREKHDSKWQEKFDFWVELHEGGSTLIEVMSKMEISRRTYYRYLEYYKSINQ